MPVRPLRPNQQIHSVQTVDPRTVGQTVPQITLPPKPPESNDLPLVDASAWPVNRWADWTWSSVFTRADQATLSYRSADALFCCCAAAQAYLPLSIASSTVSALLPGVTVERIEDIGPDHKSLDIYDGNGWTLLSIPGTQGIRELLRESGVTLAQYTGLPAQWWLWRGFFDIATAFGSTILATLAERLAQPDRFLILTGHSLGAVLAAWFSFYLNYISVFEGRVSKPVIACYSYASPSGWVDTTGVERFVRFHRHFRVIQAGDPVVDAVQTASVGHPADPPEGQRKYSVCQHYDTILAPTGRSTNFLPFGDSLGKAMWSLLSASGAELNAMFQRHGVDQYLSGLVSQCEGKGDTPIAKWDLLKTWVRKIGEAKLSF